MNKIIVLSLLSFLIVGIFPSCISADETKREELNLWARNPLNSPEEVSEKLLVILQDREEDPHYRATAAKLLGEFKIEDAIEPMFRILGENVTEPEVYEYLRLETVLALGNFGDVDVYRRMMILMYSLSAWEESISVRRFFIQSFKAVPDFKDNYSVTAKQAFTVEILVEMLRTAQTKKENQSLIYRIATELRRISGHPELTHHDIKTWEEVALNLRKIIKIK